MKPVRIGVCGRVVNGRQVIEFTVVSRARRQKFVLYLTLLRGCGLADNAQMVASEWRRFRERWRESVLGKDWRARHAQAKWLARTRAAVPPR